MCNTYSPLGVGDQSSVAQKIMNRKDFADLEKAAISLGEIDAER